MLDKKQVEELLDKYNQIFQESETTSIFGSFLNENIELYNRKNFNGHITSSAFLIDKSAQNILLLFHETLHQWFQPGGHVETIDESILAGAERELAEETPYQEFRPMAIEGHIHLPIDIDSHWIPENKKKEEAAHYHHDFRYLFQLDIDIDIVEFNSINKDFKWVPIPKLLEMNGFEKAGSKIAKMVDL
jgi:8-oxo-dGTP pyrophosphatase MutT (NUDIX family)